MKLVDIETFVVGNPPPHYGGRYFVFVKITTDGNVSGIGEAYCVPFEPHLVAKMCEDLFNRYMRGEAVAWRQRVLKTDGTPATKSDNLDFSDDEDLQQDAQPRQPGGTFEASA